MTATPITILAATADPAVPANYWLGLHPYDWVVLVIYFVVILGIGAWSYLKVSDEADYFMGGRRFGKIFMMFFAFGSGTSSEQAVSVAAGSFRTGLAGIWYQFLWLFATPFYWIIAPVMRRMRALTTSDFFEARFSASTALLYSIIGMLISIVFIGGALFASAKMIEGLAGGMNPVTGEAYFPASYAIAAMTVLFLAYGLAGGLGAAIITDFIQGVLTIIFSFLLLPFALYYAAQVSGLDSGFAALHAGTPDFPGEKILSLTVDEKFAQLTGQELITPFYILMLSLNGLIGIVVQPHIMGVCGAGKTEMEGRVGFTFGNFIKRFCTIAWSFTGLACIIIYLTPENGFIDSALLAEIQSDPVAMKGFGDQVFGKAAHDILPTISHGLVGLLMAALLAAVMSTCDAQMVVASGLFTENIYKKYLVQDCSKQHYVWVGRWAGLGVVALSLLMMTQFEDVIQVLKDYIIPIPAFIGLAFWFGIVWRGFTPAAVWCSTFVAGLFWYLTQTHIPFGLIARLGESPILQQNIDYYPFLFREMLHGWVPGIMTEILDAAGQVVNYKTSTPHQYLIYLSAGALAGFFTSLVTRRTPDEKLDHFFRLIRTPVTPGEVVTRACTLPENHLPPETDKLINHPDLEIPMPTKVGMIGFLGSWAMVGVVIALTYWLASLGGG
jgi:Na+/proline symporter